MNRDDIIRMAEEASGGRQPDGWGVMLDHEQLERFASLVASAEREAIAKMIEDVPPLVSFAQNDKGGCMICGFTPKLAAETIRKGEWQ